MSGYIQSLNDGKLKLSGNAFVFIYTTKKKTINLRDESDSPITLSLI